MKQLTKLEAHEISLVPKGANKKKFLVLKELKGDPAMADSNGALAADAPAAEMHDGALSDKAQIALKAVVRILAPFKDEITDDMLDAALAEAGMKVDADPKADPAAPAADPAAPAKAPMAKDDYNDGTENENDDDDLDMGDDAEWIDMSDDQKMQFKKALLKKMKVSKKLEGQPSEKQSANEAKDGKTVGGQEKGTTVEKSDGNLDLSKLPEAVRKHFEGQMEAVKKAEERATAAEAVIKAQKDEALEKDCVVKAEALSNLGTDKAELAKIFKSLSEKCPEEFAKIEGVLKAANEAISKGDLFKTVGSPLGKPTGAVVSYDDFVRAAETHVAKSDKKMTRSEAIDSFLSTDDGRKLYAQHQAGRKDGI